jgi:hypothetical protein
MLTTPDRAVRAAAPRRTRRAALALAMTAALTPPIERRRAAAQAATPVSNVAGVPWAPGVVAEIFVAVPSVQFPGQTIYLALLTFQPGGELPPHRHPGTAVVAVTAGVLSWTLVSGTAHLIHHTDRSQPDRGEIRMPMELLLDVGDAIATEADVVSSARAFGQEPAVVLATLILATGQPLLLPAGPAGAGTPVGTPSS